MRTKEGNKEQDILEAAIKIFAETGYHNAKIHKIAETAGVATGSVYVYYKNKEAILLTIFEKLWEKLFFELNSLVQKSEASPVEKLDGMIDLLFDVFIQNPSMALVFVNEQNHLLQQSPQAFTPYYTKFLDLGEEIANEGISKGVFHENLDVKILRMFIFGGIRHLLHTWAHDPQSISLNAVRQSVKFFVKKGMLN